MKYRVQGKVTCTSRPLRFSTVESGLKVPRGSRQRIANCSCTYLLVYAPCDILNKTCSAGGE